MTEPIIINGVDVSKCEGLRPRELTGICMAAYAKAGCIHCKDNFNCLYKQLQRKTAECEELTKAYKDLITQIAKTDVYSSMCDECKDDVLLSPNISGKTDYTDEEVYSMTLQRIISQLSDKAAECEGLKQLNEQLRIADTEKNDIVIQQSAKLQIATDALERIRYREIESFDMTEAEYEIEMADTEFSDTLTDCEKALERIKE